MAAGSSGHGWFKDVASNFTCRRRIDDETEEVNQVIEGPANLLNNGVKTLNITSGERWTRIIFVT